MAIYRLSRPKPAKGLYPPPVYEASYADGVTVRMSFWSKQGKPIDLARGRKVCQQAHAALLWQIASRGRQYWTAHERVAAELAFRANITDRPVSGHIEHESIGRLPDITAFRKVA